MVYIPSELYAPLILTLLFGFAHLFFERYAHHLRRFDVAFTSFSAGIFLSYIFVSMFPEIEKGVDFVGEGIFFIFFWGFVIFHIAEKYVMYYIKDEKDKAEKLVHVRTVAFFANHFVMGMAIILFFRIDRPVLAYISFIPIFYHMMSSSLVIEHLHRHVRETWTGRILSSGSVFLGALLCALIEFSKELQYGIFAFITGILLYIIIRDTLPRYREGKPNYFLAGVIFYLFLVGIEVFFG